MRCGGENASFTGLSDVVIIHRYGNITATLEEEDVQQPALGEIARVDFPPFYARRHAPPLVRRHCRNVTVNTTRKITQPTAAA